MESTKIMLMCYSVIFIVAFSIWAVIEYQRRNKKEVNDSLTELKKERHSYYLKLILSLMDGRMKQLSTQLYLEKVPVMYYYYSLDDIAIYIDDEILESLKRKNISSKFDSANNLILNYKNE